MEVNGNEVVVNLVGSVLLLARTPVTHDGQVHKDATKTKLSPTFTNIKVVNTNQYLYLVDITR